MTLISHRVRGIVGADVSPLIDYSRAGIERALDDWHWLSLMFNRVNRAMDQRDPYPFIITWPVAERLAFVHRVIVGARIGVAS